MELKLLLFQNQIEAKAARWAKTLLPSESLLPSPLLSQTTTVFHHNSTMQLPQQLSDGMKSIKNRLSRGNDEAPNVSLSPAMVVPASPRKIIFHLVRHAQAKHDDMSNYLYEEERLSWTDPKLTKLGEQQATTLCKNFSRMPFITTLISSPSRRSIQTAIHAFAPAIKEGLDIQVSPFFKEFTSFNCNQPLLIGMLQEKFKKKDCIDWKRLMEEPDYWKSGWPLLEFQFNLEVHAEFCRQILYDIGKKVIEAGAVNTEGNAEIAVVGHVIALNCLMGNIACKSEVFFIVLFLYWTIVYVVLYPHRTIGLHAQIHNESPVLGSIPSTAASSSSHPIFSPAPTSNLTTHMKKSCTTGPLTSPLLSLAALNLSNLSMAVSRKAMPDPSSLSESVQPHHRSPKNLQITSL